MCVSNEAAVREVCERFDHDRTRLLDVVREVDERLRCVDDRSMDAIARELKVPRADVEGVVSFYSFLSTKDKGEITIRVCNDVVDRMKGGDEVAAAFEQALGVPFGGGVGRGSAGAGKGGVDGGDIEGGVSLEYTSCIGMCDQAPAALVNDVVVTRLTPSAARTIVRKLKDRSGSEDLRTLLADSFGDGNNSHDLVRSMVENSIRRAGEVVLAPYESDAGLTNAFSSSPQEVIRVIKASRLRGRGGAGFPAGVKWEHTRAAAGDQKYIICNADEGEPGTFKDRVILTERAHLMFDGMTIAGYAIGATQGIVYLRAEYAYLRHFLDDVLAARRRDGRLGSGLADGFSFDIQIRMGAGAYVCGEETALIESLEGKRGQPRFKPPFPAVKGYLGKPTCVNNVETFCCVARIFEKGSAWFSSIGSAGSSGTKVLSISGDCHRPGIYEVPFGVSLRDVLALCGATDVAAVQVGGPSGRMVPPADFDRTLCYDDLATGGALIVFNQGRDLIDIASQYLGFFIHESCGYCTPCRVGNTLLKERIDRIRDGHGHPSDLDYLKELSSTITTASRCGLGWTSPNPVTSLITGFPELLEQRIPLDPSNNGTGFDLETSLRKAGQDSGLPSYEMEV